MTDSFARAVNLLIDFEGGYANDARDAGGETKFGISKARYPDEDIARLTLARAELLYRRDYWDAYRCGELPWPVAFLLFDGVVNHNPRNPVRWLQNVVGATPDGVLGPRTVAAATAFNDPVGAARDMTVQRIAYVKTLPDYPRFGNGWHARHVRALTEAVRGWGA